VATAYLPEKIQGSSHKHDTVLTCNGFGGLLGLEGVRDCVRWKLRPVS
jgi:hypothetical protein